MESFVATAKPIEELSCLHFVFLHHGYHGQARDFYYLSSIAENALKPKSDAGAPVSPSSSPHFVFIHPRGSDFLRTEEGVLACARRYVRHACAIISKTLSSYERRNNEGEDGVDGTDDGSHAAANLVSHAAPIELHFSAVGHSMGGLVLRAAFPLIMDNVEHLTCQHPHVRSVHWDAFCTMAAPHLGVCYLRSPVLTFVGGKLGHRVSTALADLFSKNTLITDDLVTEESLAAWARFKRRVILSVVNDDTVLVYSSSFVMPMSVRQRIRVAIPSPPLTPQFSAQSTAHASEQKESTIADVVRFPSRNNDHSDPATMTYIDLPNTDASVVQLAKQGIYCASSVEGLRRNAYELNELSEELWPSAALPGPRALAERILRRVGPLELHLIDFRPLRDAPVECVSAHIAKARAELSVFGRLMTRLGAHRFSHGAMVCKSPFYYPAFFGVASEYVVIDLLGIPLTIN